MKKFLLNLLFCICPFVLLAQEDALYSQYMFNNLLINPAYSGYKEEINASILGRSQWTGIKGAPKTQSFLVDGAFFENKNVGLGVAIVNDRAGLQGQTSAYANYSYRLPVSQQSRLCFGLGLGVAQYTLYAKDAEVDDQTDQNFSANQNYFSPDARFGVYFNNDKFYIGASATNLLAELINKNKPRAQFVILPTTHLFLTAGGIFNVDDDVKIKPSIMLRDSPSSIGNIDINGSVLIKEKVWIGASYRIGVDMWKNKNSFSSNFQQNSVVGVLEVFIAKQFRIGYAYDYALSTLNNYTSGTHEISIGYTIGSKVRNNTLLTPRYF